MSATKPATSVRFAYVDVFAEDPATGTAAGPLAARLVRDGVVPDGTTVVTLQGAALGRPSEIHIDISISAGTVRIGGSGLVIGEGTLWI